MAKIKFSSNYPKLWNQTSAKLINVQIVDGKELDKDLVEYDTRKIDGTYYELPNTMLIQLVFLGNKGIPFCTLRRHTNAKYEYYASLVGEELEVAIGDDDEMKFKYKDQVKINEFRKLFDQSCRADMNVIKLNPSAGRRHNQRITEICLALMYDIKTPFYTEIKFKTGYKPDIFCPLYLNGCVIEVRDSETDKQTKAKEVRIPEELGSLMTLYNDAKEPFDLEDIQ